MKGKDGIRECHVCRNRGCAPYDEPCRSCKRTKDGRMKYFLPIEGYEEENDKSENYGLRDCRVCRYAERDEDVEPCKSCFRIKVNYMSNFEPLRGAPAQPTIPPMPKVIPPKDGGAELRGEAKELEDTPTEGTALSGFDFAEVLARTHKDIKRAYILNAICYILRYEDKGDIGDINKAVWNLDRLAELKGDKDNG